MKKPIPISNDEALNQLLKELPRESASPDFVKNTLLASHTRKKTPPFRFPIWVAIGALATLAGLFFFRPISSSEIASSSGDTPQAVGTINEDLQSLQAVTRELERLDSNARTKRPILRVSDPANRDYFIDLRSFAAVTSQTTYAHLRPTRTL